MECSPGTECGICGLDDSAEPFVNLSNKEAPNETVKEIAETARERLRNGCLARTDTVARLDLLLSTAEKDKVLIRWHSKCRKDVKRGGDRYNAESAGKL